MTTIKIKGYHQPLKVFRRKLNDRIQKNKGKKKKLEWQLIVVLGELKKIIERHLKKEEAGYF